LSNEVQQGDQDWGTSDGARLAEAREANSHKQYELQFQLKVLALLSAVALILVGFDLAWGRTAAKDLLVVLLPAFTFVLGKIDRRDA